MDLSTTYLGFRLPHPIMPGASPLVDDLDMVRRLEDAGAAAIVMHSLFEEQIEADAEAAVRLAAHAHGSPEASHYFPGPHEFPLGPDQYLEQIRRIRAAVGVPVIASLNGATTGGWYDHARLIQDAGAHALELNIWALAGDPRDSAATVEARVLQIVAGVRRAVSIPVAVKLAPSYSALAHLAAELDGLGVAGLVLFNRFYQPDIDVEGLEVVPRLHLSTPQELLSRLTWLAVLSGQVRASLAVTGGVHGPIDALKAVMAGAHAVQLVSALLVHGPAHLTHVRDGLAAWLEAHDYESLAQAQGSMSRAHCPDPAAFARANYARILQSWGR